MPFQAQDHSQARHNNACTQDDSPTRLGISRFWVLSSLSRSRVTRIVEQYVSPAALSTPFRLGMPRLTESTLVQVLRASRSENVWIVQPRGGVSALGLANLKTLVHTITWCCPSSIPVDSEVFLDGLVSRWRRNLRAFFSTFLILSLAVLIITAR